MELVEKISIWIRKVVNQAKARGVVIGLSGGIDSSVVACLAKKALGAVSYTHLTLPTTPYV